MSYEKWLWIELIGFDNTLPDYGVSEFLARMAKPPSVAALLLFSPDIIHLHTGLERDFRIGLQYCSYGGRTRNEERGRQDWTAFQLRGLVGELTARGIETFASVFNITTNRETAKRSGVSDFDAWSELHPELRYTLVDGNISECLCVWKHLSDGTPYEDFLAAKLPFFLRDYGFSGFMAADGYAQPRAPICQGDFSSNMIGQFSEFSGIEIPDGTVPEKAAFILSFFRGEWCRFHVERQARFMKKITAAVHGTGKKIVALSAWARDPFEAIWRYGVDYRAMAEAGIDALVIESSAGTVELEKWDSGETTSMLDRNRAMLMRMRNFLPNIKFILLHCLKDDREGYCVLRHSPQLAEAEALSLISMRSATTGRRCVSGVMACLSDGISPSEWKFLDEMWNNCFNFGEGLPESPLLLWSDAALDSELSAYPNERRCSSFRVTSELIAHGAPLAWSGTIDSAEKFPEYPVLAIHPFFWPEQDFKRIISRKSPVLLIGILRDGSFGVTLLKNGIHVLEQHAFLSASGKKESFFFWKSLPETLPDSGFWRRAAAAVLQCVAGPQRGGRYEIPEYLKFDPRLLRLWSFSDGTCFALNASPYYLPARIRPMHPVSSVEARDIRASLQVCFTALNNVKPIIKVKLPPFGAAVLDITYKKKEEKCTNCLR